MRSKPAFKAEYARPLAIYQGSFDDIQLADRKERVIALSGLYVKIPDIRVALKDPPFRMDLNPGQMRARGSALRQPESRCAPLRHRLGSDPLWTRRFRERAARCLWPEAWCGRGYAAMPDRIRHYDADQSGGARIPDSWAKSRNDVTYWEPDESVPPFRKRTPHSRKLLLPAVE